MYVAAGDRAAVLAAFDELGAMVFTSLCRLTAGDAGRALDLLVRTFHHLGSTSEPVGVDADRVWLLAAAHSVYLVDEGDPPPAPRAAVGALSPAERVAVDLARVEGLGLSIAAAVLDVSEDRVRDLVAAAAVQLATSAGDASVELAMRSCEVWFDDATRARARAAVRDGSALATTVKSASSTTAVGLSSPPYVDPVGSTLAGLPTRQSVQPLAGQPEFRRPKRSRWVMIGVGIATVTLLGIAAVWVSPSAGSGHGSTLPTDLLPRTTAKPPTTTAPATTETVTTDAASTVETASTGTSSPGNAVVASGSIGPPRVQLTGYIADPPPDGFAITDAYANEPQNFGGSSWLQVWASPDATFSTGRWFAVVANDNQNSGFDQNGGSSQRVDIDGHNAVVTADSGGVQWTTMNGDKNFDSATPTTIEFESRGLTNDVIGELVRGLSTDGGAISFGAEADAALRGLDLRVSRATEPGGLRWNLFGNQQFFVDYSNPTITGQFQIYVTPQTANDLETTLLLHPPSSDPAAAAFPDRRVEAGGRSVIIGAIDQGGDPKPSFIQWHDGTNTISVVGYGASLGVLLDVAKTARLATTEEWGAAVNTVPTVTSTDGNVTNFVPDGGTVIGDQQTSSGLRVITRLDPAAQGSVNAHQSDPGGTGTISVLVSSLRNGGTLDHVSMFQSLEATLLVYATETPSSGVALRVTIDGHEPVDRPLVTVGTFAAAAYVFSEFGHYEVAIIDAAGTVVTQLVP